MGLVLPGLAKAPRISQIGILVPDLPSAISTWTDTLGSDDWMIFTYDSSSIPRMTYRGKPGNFGMRVALIGREPQIELIESLQGPNIYEEWLEVHGYGTHHLGFHVDSIREAVSAVTVAGVDVIQSGEGYGVRGDGGFAYFDTESSLGVILEAIEIPSVRKPSEPIPR